MSTETGQLQAQQITGTSTFGAGSTTRRVTFRSANLAGGITRIDAVQLEAGATATPFNLAALPDIAVSVYNASEQQVGTGTTNASGYYSIGNLPSGTYRVHFGGDAAHTAAENAGVVVFLNQTTTSDVRLQYTEL